MALALCFYFFEGLLMAAEFLEVSFLEGVPLPGVMIEPFPEFLGGRQEFVPFVVCQILFADAPRPDAVDEYPSSILLRYIVISPLHLQHFHHLIMVVPVGLRE